MSRLPECVGPTTHAARHVFDQWASSGGKAPQTLLASSEWTVVALELIRSLPTPKNLP